MDIVRTAEDDSFSIIAMTREEAASLISVLNACRILKLFHIDKMTILIGKKCGLSPDKACHIMNHSEKFVKELITGIMLVAGNSEEEIEEILGSTYGI